MKKQLLFLITLCVSTLGFSQTVGDTFVDNFITYEVTSISPYEVRINDYDHDNGSADVVIENTVTNSGTTYNITSVGNEAFLNYVPATKLTSVTFITPSNVTDIGSQAFRAQNLTTVTIPSSVTIIRSSAFSANLNLASVNIQDGVITIQNSAFHGCNLTSVVIPNSVTSIGSQAFDYNNLNSVVIGDNVSTIGFGAFQNSQLTTLTIPNSVTSIGSLAFNNNPLTSVTSLATVPPTIITGTGDTFSSDRSNIALNIPTATMGAYVTDPGALWTGFNPVTEASPVVGDTFVVDYITYRITATSPDTVEVLDYDVTGGTVVNIPSMVSYSSITYEVNEIEGNAFNTKGLTSVTISDSVINIGNQAFLNNALTSATIGNSVEFIGVSSFEGNNLTDIIIPDSVTNIDARAFDNNQISSVLIGAGVTTIGFGAFRNNPLSTVLSLAVTPPTIITDPSYPAVVDSFSHDRSNIDLVITNNTTDEYVTDSGALWTGFKMVFEATSPTTAEVSTYDPTNGTSVVIPADVTVGSTVFDVVKIDDSAFENIGLTSVTIPDSVTEIGISAFELNNLTSVTIPDSVTIIGTTAFAQNSISNLSLGTNVVTIGIGTFIDNSLSDVTIPSNVTSIGLLAFSNNPLTDVTSLSTTPPTITTGTNDTFAFNRGNIHLHIPAGTMGVYVTDAGALWTGFNPVTEDALSTNDYELANDIKIIRITGGIEVVTSNNARLENYSIYNISGAKVTSGQTNQIATTTFANGIYILKLDFDRGTVVKKVIIN